MHNFFLLLLLSYFDSMSKTDNKFKMRFFNLKNVADKLLIFCKSNIVDDDGDKF